MNDEKALPPTTEPIAHPPPTYPTDGHSTHPAPVPIDGTRSGATTEQPGATLPMGTVAHDLNQIVIPVQQLTSLPGPVNCPHCHQRVITRVKPSSGNLTHLLAFICCVTTLICTPVPYCISSFKDAYHECPNCGAKLGKYNRMGGNTEVIYS